jgi:hypothetical protein
MARSFHAIVTRDGWVPAFHDDKERHANMGKGVLVEMKITQPRNYEYHKRFFAMLNFAFEYWEPDIVRENGLAWMKDFEQFRADMIVKAGYYNTVVRFLPDGTQEICFKPKSIAFTNMEEEDFHNLYKSVFNVVWDLILHHKFESEDQAQNAINHALSFT